MYIINLPYSYSALEPDINEETVYTHYNSHHKKYAENLEKLVHNNYTLEEIILNIQDFPLEDRGQILYNAGAVANHNLYWNSLNSFKSYPENKLLSQINKQYGSFDKFKEIFIDRAQNLVGSGYTFLTTDRNGYLTIINLINQDSPISYGLIPLFTIDLWEHAYYLQYKSNRNEYINNFFNKANFDYANKTYEKLF